MRRSWQPAAGDGLLVTARGRRPSLPGPHKPWLDQRLAEGTASARQPHREITARGYAGGYELVRTYLQPLRALAPPPPPPPPSARDLTRWITTRPGSPGDHGNDQLTAARARCPHLDALTRHVTGFARILTSRHGHAPTAGSPPPTPATCPPCTPSPTASSSTSTPSATA